MTPWEKVRQIAEADTVDSTFVDVALTHGDARALWAILEAAPGSPVVQLAEAAYTLGAGDAQHLCGQAAQACVNRAREALADVPLGASHGLVERATGAQEARDAILILDAARGCPSFVLAALRALGAPDADEHTCADEEAAP